MKFSSLRFELTPRLRAKALTSVREPQAVKSVTSGQASRRHALPRTDWDCRKRWRWTGRSTNRLSNRITKGKAKRRHRRDRRRWIVEGQARHFERVFKLLRKLAGFSGSHVSSAELTEVWRSRGDGRAHAPGFHSHEWFGSNPLSQLSSFQFLLDEVLEPWQT